MWQAGGRERNAARRKPRRSGPGRTTPSKRKDGGEAGATGASTADAAPADTGDKDLAPPCYGPDKSLTPVAPPKGTLIDVAI